MNNDFLEILEAWAKYTKYDRNKNKFNLNSYEYEFHKLNQRIEDVLTNYDNSGVVATIMAKNFFLDMLDDIQISLSMAITQPEQLKKDIEMYNLFNSDLVNNAENYYANLINDMSQKIINKKLIGNSDDKDFKKVLFSYTDLVVNSLNKCNVEVYKKGGIITNITKISTHIQIFTSLANCLLALENAKDGIYLCYIDVYQSADGYFGFFIKNNGNIFSINERVDEAYKGSHQCSRNGRWTEAKQDNLFPYDFIFSYDNYDYKGYSHKYVINEEQLSFFELTEKVYVPILLAMIMLIRKYQGKELTKNIVYVDSLLPINIPNLVENKNELAIIEKNEIVLSHQNVNLNFSIDDILSGNALNEFIKEDLSYKEHFSAMNTGQIFVDLYGEGFSFDVQELLSNKQNLLVDSSNEYYPEFIGSETRLRAQCYYDIRKQLADYIRKQMKKEYISFGGINSVKNWFQQNVQKNLNNIEKMLVEKYKDIQNGGQNIGVSWRSSDKNILCDISYIEDSYPSGCYGFYFLNDKEPYKSKVYDMRTNVRCSMYFVVRPKNYLALEKLFGEEVPKIIKGWDDFGHNRTGNSILNLTDAVEGIGTPFEYDEAKKYDYRTKELYDDPYYRFAFVIGYSKSGFKKLLKEIDTV